MAQISFADMHEGQVFALGPVTMTRDDLLSFAAEFDPQPFHLDEEVAKSSVLGGLASSGWHTSSLLMRMICDALFLKVNALGSSGIEEMKWLKPVYADDVLAGELRLTGVRRSASRPDMGVVTFEASIADQTEKPVAFMRSMVFVGAAP